MRSRALTITLILTAAALVSAAALPSSQRIPGLAARPNPACHRIHAQVLSARSLPNTADTNITATPHSILSARDPPDLCGVLRGDQRSASFTLDPNTKWNVFWDINHFDAGGMVHLHETEPGSRDAMPIDFRFMRHRQFANPFTPRADRQYAVSLWAPRPAEPAISWYFATQ